MANFELNNQVISKYCLKLLLESDSDQHRTTRYMLHTYIALRLMAMDVDGRVIIPSFNRYRLFKFMRDDLGMGNYMIMSENSSESHCVSKQSIYTSFDRLKRLGLVSELNDPDFGYVCTMPMEFLGFKPSSGDKTDELKGFVRIPEFLVSSEYFGLTLRDQKATLYILQKLYNEHDSKNINFLSRSERKTTPEEKTEFEIIMKICRINRFAHIKQILSKLKAFFHIDEVRSFTRKTFNFSLHEQFRLPSKRRNTASTQNADYNTTIHTLLRKMLDNVNTKLSDNVIMSMVKAINSFDFNTQKAAIDQLVQVISTGKFKKINNHASYLKGIALNLQTD